MEKLNRRETIILCLLCIVLIGFFMQTWAMQKTVNEYIEVNTKCLEAVALAERGWLPVNGDMTTNLRNITLPYNLS